MATPEIVLIDTDPGIDDAMALLFLKRRPDVNLAAITTVFGNADIATTTRNAEYLADRFGIDAPVIAGADRPLRIERIDSPAHVHGSDGLGDALPLPPVREQLENKAAEHIVRLVRSMPHRVNLLAVGPLTNLALALRLDAGIAGLTRSVVVMGGAFGWHGPRGNASPHAEANIFNDPHAAHEVLAARWNVTMIGLDATTRCVLPARDAKRLAASGDAAVRLLWNISRGYEALYQRLDGLAGCCLHDVTAAAFIVDPTLFKVRRGLIDVAIEGAAIGQTTLHSSDAGLPDQQACHDVDVARFMTMYEQTLLSTANET